MGFSFKPNTSFAFEVWINEDRIWSKLKSGGYPTLDTLHHIIQLELPRIKIKNIFSWLGFGILLLIISELDKKFFNKSQKLDEKFTGKYHVKRRRNNRKLNNRNILE